MMPNLYNPGPMHYLVNPQMGQGQVQQSSDFLTQYLANLNPQHRGGIRPENTCSTLGEAAPYLTGR